jgi:hypothetical protein
VAIDLLHDLALRRDVPATPIGESPEPTPTPQDSIPSSQPTETATQEPPQTVETLTGEQAEQLLDSIQQNQQTLRDRLNRLTPQANPAVKDW